MQQSHPTNKSMKQKIFALLSDGMIHGCNELLRYGLSYRNRVAELRQDGYDIRTIRRPKVATAFYQLIT